MLCKSKLWEPSCSTWTNSITQLNLLFINILQNAPDYATDQECVQHGTLIIYCLQPVTRNVLEVDIISLTAGHQISNCIGFI